MIKFAREIFHDLLGQLLLFAMENKLHLLIQEAPP